MERVQSLINKLAGQLQNQAATLELFKTTELLYAELKQVAVIDTVKVQNGIAVWLPSGYGAQVNGKDVDTAPASLPVNQIMSQQTSELDAVSANNSNHATVPAESISSRPNDLKKTSFGDRQPVQAEPVIPVQENMPGDAVQRQINIPQLPRIPVPPTVINVPLPAPEPAQPEPGLPTVEVKDANQFFTLDLPEEEQEEEMDRTPATSHITPTEQPGVFTKPDPVPVKPFPQYPDAATLMKNIFPLAPDPAPPAKELNQLVVDPAIQLNEKFGEKKVELAELLAAGPKISDLRKAISINDKYQMINLLFRGDEDMFERSIRTLNNFGSLPEARFWMQRELVLKLGWNEKEETVQHFQKLVSRRFA